MLKETKNENEIKIFYTKEGLENIILKHSKKTLSILKLIHNSFKPRVYLKGHKGWIRSINVYKNKIIISTSQDRMIKFWNIEKGDLIKSFKGHNIAVLTSILLKKKKNLLVSGGHDKMIFIWDVEKILKNKNEKVQSVFCLYGHTNSVRSLLEISIRDNTMFSGNLISGAADKSIRIWDLDTRKCIKIIKEAHRGTVYCLNEIPEENLLISGCGPLDNNIKVWSLINLDCLKILNGHANSVRSVIYVNKMLVSGSWDFKIKFWDKDNENCLKTLNDHQEYVIIVLQLKNGYLISGSEDKTMRIWNLNGDCINVLEGAHTSYVKVVVELKNGEIISGSADKNICIHSKIERHVNEKELSSIFEKINLNEKIKILKLNNLDLLSKNESLFKKFLNLIEENKFLIEIEIEKTGLDNDNFKLLIEKSLSKNKTLEKIKFSKDYNLFNSNVKNKK